MEFENNELLDDTWIKEFETIDKDYENFYSNDVFFINIHFIYINSQNVIDNIKEHKFIMSTPNYIHRDELVGLIKHNYIKNDNKYILLSILKYNFKLEPENINTFLRDDDIDCFNVDFFTPIKNIDTIKFEKTIDMFQDLNDLFFVFYEKTNGNQNQNQTHEINQNNIIKSDFYTNIVKNHSFTKRIFFQKSKNIKNSKKHKKTQRKTV